MEIVRSGPGPAPCNIVADNASDIEAWRTDAEDLRTSLASFATAHPEMQIEIPETLPEHPSIELLRPQLDKLSAAVGGAV